MASLSVITLASAPAQIDQYAGNKGRSLFRLGTAGLRVPPWAILGADMFAALRKNCGLEVRIGELLQGFTPETAAPVSQAIIEAVLAADVSPALQESIAAALFHIGDVPIAVRSSGIEEDGAQFSFAGQFDTFLGVQGLAATLEHVRKCWASAYSERSLRYRHQHGLDLDTPGMAVI